MKNNKNPPKKPDNWYYALEITIEIFSNAQTQFFLDSGTLLGFVRDGDFIQWDNDIDIGVIEDSQNRKVICDEIFRRGIPYYETQNSVGFNINGVPIGITFYQEKHDYYHAYYWSYIPTNLVDKMLSSILLLRSNLITNKIGLTLTKNTIYLMTRLVGKFLPDWMVTLIINRTVVKKVSIIPKEHFQKIVYNNFDGKLLPVPKNPNLYLELRYGSSWNIPKQDYQYIHDDQSLHKTQKND